MAGLDDISQTGKRIIEAPKEIIDEAIGLVGDGINGALAEVNSLVNTTFTGIKNVADDGMGGIKGVIERPLKDISARTSTLGGKLRT